MICISGTTRTIRYAGFIQLESTCHPISITKESHPPYFRLSSLTCHPALRIILSDHLQQLDQALRTAETHHQAHDVLGRVTKMAVQAQAQSGPAPAVAMKVDLDVVQQLSELNWQHISNVSADFSVVEFDIPDQSNRQHSLKLNLSESQLTWQHALPKDMDIPGDVTTVRQALTLFEAELARYQNFWQEQQLLQTSFVVLDPNPMRTSHVHVRIALKQSVSIYLTVNPDAPWAKPLLQVFGPESRLAAVQAQWDTFDDWNDNESIVANLKACFHAEAFEPISHDNEMDTGVDKTECAVCYSYMLDDKPPTEVCNNVACGRVYHAACLLEWLMALPDSRRSFKTLYGECPFCQATMAVEIEAEL
eukprot:TRINITY_DN11644_c0_g2_i1.p1 TRINITY_DN11644_c0_g2~~TRINITY_DN11644_c0_g2_i1.p1  ORF type:complete len:363 (+),score=93.48 TRINITY_DN11644_c0_g2_i1:424-1512(+)